MLTQGDGDRRLVDLAHIQVRETVASSLSDPLPVGARKRGFEARLELQPEQLGERFADGSASLDDVLGSWRGNRRLRGPGCGLNARVTRDGGRLPWLQVLRGQHGRSLQEYRSLAGCGREEHCAIVLVVAAFHEDSLGIWSPCKRLGPTVVLKRQRLDHRSVRPHHHDARTIGHPPFSEHDALTVRRPDRVSRCAL